MEKYYYPAVKTEFNKGKITLYTVLRVGSGGIWYDWKFIKSFGANVFSPDDMIKFINDFHQEIYLAKMGVVVDVNLTDAFDQPLFPKSDLQVNELQRIKLKYSLNED